MAKRKLPWSKKNHHRHRAPTIKKPSPAAKVFALPELLENIFVHLAESAVSDQGDDYKVHAIQPLTCLSGVQRVSTSFRYTITASQKLQRLMTAPLVSGEPDAFRLFGGSLYIDISELHKRRALPVPGPGGEISNSLGSLLPDRILQSKRFRESTWRKARIQGACTTRMEVRVVIFDDMDEDDSFSFDLAQDATLGDLVDVCWENETARQQNRPRR